MKPRTPPETGAPQASAAFLERSWREALAVWDVQVNLSAPEPQRRPHRQGNRSDDEPLAYIDLETRQVVVDLRQLEALGAVDSLAAVLAHEIGHHVRFPHTLGLAAELQLLEKRLIPGLPSSLTNLVFDLLVNEVVGRTHAQDLCRVYQGFVRSGGGKLDPLFFYYLAIYEELWGLEPGELVPKRQIASMEERYPGCRADARLFVQTFYALPEIRLQFVYFCARFIRYIPDPSKLQVRSPFGHDVPLPDADDFDAVLRGAGAEEAADALEEAQRRGWLDDSGLESREPADELRTIDRVASGRPGSQQAEFKLVLVSRHYKRLVDRYVFEPPPVTPVSEPFLPSVTEEWELGDNPRSIDWTASVLSRGPLAGVRPLRRDLEPDEPPPESRSFPAVEIYLDTSGSMPDPATALNAMTLAAQILAASALRKKGMVRGVVYSAGPPLVSPWMYDEETARRFLLHYAGGGTDYPFALLEKFCAERQDVIRVIVSDSDFLSNVRQAGAMDKLKLGVQRSRLLVAFLSSLERSARTALEPVLALPKFRLVLVPGPDKFGEAASLLAGALFGR
jgi:hypothetical protein